MELTGFQLVKKFPTFYLTRRFITAFTSARHVSLYWDRSIQSIPPHIRNLLKIHLNIILPSTPGSPKWSLPLRFPPLKPCTRSPLPHTRYMTRPSNSSRFDLPTNIWWAVIPFSSSLCSFLHSPVTSSLLSPNIPLSTLFSNTLSLRSSVNVNDQFVTSYILKNLATMNSSKALSVWVRKCVGMLWIRSG